MAFSADEDRDEVGPSLETGVDPARLAVLYLDYGPELRRFITAVLRDRDQAADVLQNAFLKALERGGSIQGESLRGWLYRVALNEALLVRRKRLAREQILRRIAHLFDRPSSRPDDGLVRGETVEEVRRLIANLSEAEQAVLRARVYEERPFADIARDQGVPLGTVLTRMHRALEKLRRASRKGGEP